MIILEDIFYELVQQLPEQPPEIGGLPGTIENMIDHFWIAHGFENRKSRAG